jgi:hypothetical protein
MDRMMIARRVAVLLVVAAGWLSCAGQAPASQQTKTSDQARTEKLREDVARLVALATTLKEGVDRTKKDEISVEVLRDADRIEQLARSLKEHPKQ